MKYFIFTILLTSFLTGCSGCSDPVSYKGDTDTQIQLDANTIDSGDAGGDACDASKD